VDARRRRDHVPRPRHDRHRRAGSRRPTTLFATAGGHLFKSSDAGASWNPAGSGIASGDYVRAVAVDPTASSVVYAGVMVFFPFDQLIRRNQPGLFTAKSGTN